MEEPKIPPPTTKACSHKHLSKNNFQFQKESQTLDVMFSEKTVGENWSTSSEMH